MKTINDDIFLTATSETLIDNKICTLLLVGGGAEVRLLRDMFNEPNLRDIKFTHVECVNDAEKYIAERAPDIIFLDLGLPDARGLEAVRRVHAAAASASLVVLTNSGDDALAMQALQAGAQDYLIKSKIDTRGLLRTCRYAIDVKRRESAFYEMAVQMAHSTEHDFLTALPNRMLLNDRLTHAIGASQRQGKTMGVLYLDLDGFKHVNNSLGYKIGDMLLQSVATRLGECVRLGDTVSRQGGDEFVIMLSELEQAEDAADMARRILQAVARPHCIDEQELHVTASIGVSLYPDDGADAETLIKNADTAMYQGKENGRHSYQFFKSAMNVLAVERQSIEEELRRALERNEFALHYQPKIDLRTGAITGAEALIRWTHPTRGSVAPVQFIHVAEEAGLIVPIGAWVIREACRQARAWLDAGLPQITMAVNVSALEFRSENFLDGVFTVLAETELSSGALELEITESVLMKREVEAVSILEELRGRGVRVAIDDFGTGYSNLSYLRKFRVDCLKIDQSFVRQLGVSGDGCELVAAMIDMARSLKLRVVAEGVETLEELALLRTLHCDEAQGYYFSRPVPAEQFAKLLETGISADTALLPSEVSEEPGGAAEPIVSSRLDIQPGSAWSGRAGERTRQELADDRRVYLARQLGGRREFRLALGAIIVSALGFLAAVPFVTMPLLNIPAFIPAYQSALVVCDLITAVLLFSQFNVLRARALFVLACGYLFTAFIAFAHCLTFPGAFSPTGLLGAGTQSTAWLYMFWHGGFPLFVIAYAFFKDELREARDANQETGVPNPRNGIPVFGGIVAVFSLVVALTLIATAGHDFLPILIVSNRFTPTMSVVVSGIWLICLISLAALWWRTPRSVLDLWLMVVICAWLFDIALSSIFNAARYDVGWYGGRIYGLLAASFLLIVLQIENGTYYAKLAQLSAEMRQLSRHDSLTDLANRRFFDAYLDRQIAVARRHEQPLALVLCDVDAFKAYNDHYGHQAGDECLRQIASALQSCCRRPADMAARYGGEEFAIILPDTDFSGATLIAEAVREAIAQLKIPHAQSPVGSYVTISGGVAILLPKTDITAHELIMAADARLFQAKRLGRDRVIFAQAKAA